MTPSSKVGAPAARAEASASGEWETVASSGCTCAVNNWLEDNGDLFGLTPTQEAPQASEMDRATLRQQDVLTQGALTPDRAEDINMRIDQAQSSEELINLIYSQQR